MGNASWMSSSGIIQGAFSKQMAALQLPIRKKFVIKSQSLFEIGEVWLWKITLIATCSIVQLQCSVGVLLSTHSEVKPS